MTDILKKHPTPWRVERSCVDSDFVCIRDAHETQVVSFVLAIYRHTDIDKVLDFIVSAVNEKAECVELVETAKAFLVKHDEVEPAVTARFQFAQIHGMAYKGPTYEHEIAAFRAALAKMAPLGGKEDER
jgi:hypothetical protein